MRAAMVDDTTDVVLGVIMADANIDPAPAGSFLVNVPDDLIVNPGWVYDPANQSFANPNPVIGEVIY